MDVVSMPVSTLLDKLVFGLSLGPFRCRACRRKFYRRVRRVTEDSDES